MAKNMNEETLVHSSSSILSGMGEPQGANRAYLIVVAGPGAGEMFPIQGLDLLIGRASECNVVLEHTSVSRHHARLSFEASNIVIEDLGSTNGTFVNGTRITRHILHDGEKIQVGCSVILKFSYQDSIDEQFQRRLFESAVKDSLTQLYNRKYMIDRLATDFSHAIRHNRPLSIMMMDLDHFKTVNDTFGHPAGDAVLRKLAKVILPAVRSEDTFARYGGEEFVLILRDCDPPAALALAERIRSAVERTVFNFEDKTIPVTISIGVATLYNGNYPAPSHLLKAADQFLYAAKGNGRNRVESITSGRATTVLNHL